MGVVAKVDLHGWDLNLNVHEWDAKVNVEAIASGAPPECIVEIEGVTAEIMQMVASFVGRDVDADLPLVAQGLDSLAAMELRQKLQVCQPCYVLLLESAVYGCCTHVISMLLIAQAGVELVHVVRATPFLGNCPVRVWKIEKRSQRNAYVGTQGWSSLWLNMMLVRIRLVA